MSNRADLCDEIIELERTLDELRHIRRNMPMIEMIDREADDE